ncbi:C2 domain protein [Opisthorchis viverrini]|uniref:C2 domain protein n=1 Tax=Opisthorchis viverrini TaxID=6198 RepID=A0A1S8X0E7_OPIVI|nr:C2 domain protein [Opisthorchis viverrini]
MDANGLSDPYVVCEILPSSQHSPRPRTSTRPQCLNPVWNEALTFEPVEEKTLHHKTLRFAVLDEDLYGSDWLGEYWLALNRLTPDRLTDFTVPLGPKKPVSHFYEFCVGCSHLTLSRTLASPSFHSPRFSSSIIKLHRGERDLACPTRGKIQLGLRFLEERRQLCVEVIRCSDLASMDPNGLSDPFVKL